MTEVFAQEERDLNASMKFSAVFSRQTTEWETPHDLFKALEASYRFTLDVCATPANAKCEAYFTKDADGLAHAWGGTVWCNPPYGRHVGRWLEKARTELALGHCAVVVFLLPARTDTRWFHDYVWDNQCHHPRTGIELQLIAGRLRFQNATSSAPFPSMLVVMRAC